MAKVPEAQEYVLYQNDFSAAPDDFRVLETSNGATVSVSDGNYVMDASGSNDAFVRVLLPEFLDVFGDITVEASMKFALSVDNTKWASLMYRVQNGGYPFYHVCMRRNCAAGNGLEIALRNPSYEWDVFEKAAFAHGLNDNYNLLKVAVRGTVSTYSVNGHEMFITSPSSKSVCDVTSGGGELQAANLPKKRGSYLVVILFER